MTQINKQLSDQERQEQETWYDQFLDATPNQVETWIENNVTDLQSAKTVLKKLARVVVILAKTEKARRL